MNKTYYVCGKQGMYEYTCTVDRLWKATNIRRFVESSFWGFYHGVLIIDATALMPNADS